MSGPDNKKQILPWVAAALLATAVFLVVVVWQRGATPRPRALYIVGDPQKGAALFFGKKQCAFCHSINGAGGRVAPDLSGKRPHAPAMGWLATVLWNHAPGMWRQMRHGNVSYPHLSTEEMAHILAFLYQAGTVDRAGDQEAGRKVFEQKGCVHCHSVHGVGGKVAPELSPVAASGDESAWTRAMWNHAQSMVDPVTQALGTWPQFSGPEMNNLIAYISGGASATHARAHPLRGSAEQGWRVFQVKCIGCHSVRGQGGTLGPELGPAHDLPLSSAEFASVLWNHAPAMLGKVRAKGTSLPLLEGNEVADLHTFLASLRYFEPSGSTFVGERVFSERGCAHCHGTAGEGTGLGPKLASGPEAFTTISFATALWKHSPRMVDRAQELGIRWPVLEATDIGDLVSFLNDPMRHK